MQLFSIQKSISLLFQIYKPTFCLVHFHQSFCIIGDNEQSFLICLLYIIWDFIGFQFLPSPKLCSLAEKISEPPIILQVWVPNVFIEWPKDRLCFSVPFLEIPSIWFAFLPQLNTQLLYLQNSPIIHVFTKYN